MKGYLLDTQAFIFWLNAENISKEFIEFLDEKNTQGELYISSISFWEIALLVKKGRIQIDNLLIWKSDVLNHTGIQVLSPSIEEMIRSTELDNHHKYPFDRILIAQTLQQKLTMITNDHIFPEYKVPLLWVD